MIHSFRLLRERVEAEADKLTKEIGRGVASDFAQYKMLCGQVVGMENCLKLCEEIEREMDERSNPASGD